MIFGMNYLNAIPLAIYGIFVVILSGLIVRKAGFSPLWSLIMLTTLPLPIISIFPIWWFAFSSWPVLKNKN